MFLGSWHKESGAGPDPAPAICAQREQGSEERALQWPEEGGRGMLRKGQAVVERNSQEGPGGRALPLPTPKPNTPSQTLGSQ